ncbi:MAG TPA: ABC transporter substrate-binding protein [Candidatus Ruthenibacterium merdigallinarum]|nr:ABC transporter substrate-binding protein [Candidatus Ruthenibacterium merdigallinarum]
MNTNLKRLLCTALAALTVIGATACGGQESSSTAAVSSAAETSSQTAAEPVEITFYSYSLLNAGQKDGTQKLIDEFMAEHPDIKVTGVAVSNSDMAARLQADMTAGEVPDVAQLPFRAMDFAAHSLGAVPINELAGDEFDEQFSGFYPNGLALGELDGQTYCLPFTFSTPILYYNGALFEAAGLDPNDPPETWDEVNEYALKIKEATPGVEGVHVATTGPSSGEWICQALIYSNGGSILSDDRKTVTFNEEGGMGAMEMLRGLAESGAHGTMTEEEAQEAFMNGSLGMYLQSSALYAAAAKSAEAGGWELYGAAMPAFAGKEAVPTNSGSALFVFTQDQAKREAVWEFIKFVTSERGYTIITEDIGYLPLRPSLVEEGGALEQYAEENPQLAINLEQMSRMRQTVAFPGEDWQTMSNSLIEMVDRVLWTTDPVEDIVNETAAQDQALLDADA